MRMLAVDITDCFVLDFHTILIHLTYRHNMTCVSASLDNHLISRLLNLCLVYITSMVTGADIQNRHHESLAISLPVIFYTNYNTRNILNDSPM